MSLGGDVSEPEGQKGKIQVKNVFGMFFYITLLYIYISILSLLN